MNCPKVQTLHVKLAKFYYNVVKWKTAGTCSILFTAQCLSCFAHLKKRIKPTIQTLKSGSMHFTNALYPCAKDVHSTNTLEKFETSSYIRQEDFCRPFVRSSVRPFVCLCNPPWIMKQGELESFAWILISVNGKTKIVALLSSSTNKDKFSKMYFLKDLFLILQTFDIFFLSDFCIIFFK